MIIYVIGPKEGPQKIGITKDLKARLRNIQTGHPSKLFVHHTEEVETNMVRPLEKKIHAELNYKKLKGEWFDLTPDEAKEFVIFFNIRYGNDPLIRC